MFQLKAANTNYLCLSLVFELNYNEVIVSIKNRHIGKPYRLILTFKDKSYVVFFEN
jgi:hypothetical protein